MHVSTVVCYSIHKSIGMNVRIKTMAFWLNHRRLSNAQNRDGDQAKPRIYGQTEYAPHMYRVLVVREHFQWNLFIIGKYLQWMSQQESVLYATEVKSTCMRVYLHGICCIVPNWASSHSIFTFYRFWHYLVSVPEPYATLKWFYVSVSVLIKVLAESHSKKKLVLLFHLFF